MLLKRFGIRVKGKSKGKLMNMQRNRTCSKFVSLGRNRTYGQFVSLGRVVNSSNSRGFCHVRERKQKILIENSKDVVHENPYAALEHALTSFMTSVAQKEQVHP